MRGFGALRRVGVGLVAVLAFAGAGGTAGIVTEAAAAGAGPTGFTTIFEYPDDITCQLGSLDLGSGGAVTGIGPAYTSSGDGCPFDLAIRAGDPRIFAVVTPTAQLSSVDGLPQVPGATESSPSTEANTPDATANGSEAAPEGDGSVDAAAPDSFLVTFDPATGVRSTVGSLGIVSLPDTAGLTFDQAGNLWLYTPTDDPACVGQQSFGECLYRLDPTTGVATFVAVGESGIETPVFGATATCDAVLGSTFNFDEGGPATMSFVTIDTTTAALTPAPSDYGPGPHYVYGIERDADGTLRGLGEVGNNDSWASFTIDPVSGVATQVADVDSPLRNGNYYGLAITGLVCPVEVTPTFTG